MDLEASGSTVLPNANGDLAAELPQLLAESCNCRVDTRSTVGILPEQTARKRLGVNDPLRRDACRSGYRAKFYTASSIVTTYREAREERVVSRLESSLRKLDVIVIDELGYLPIDRAGAESLFGFFSLCYEQVSVIVTTNLPFAQWPKTFAGDERMTGALLDRLTHRVEILAIEGDSYRLKQSRKPKR